MSGLQRLGVLLAVGVVAFAAAQAQTPQRERPAGEGVICAWAIYSAMAEVGERCFEGRYTEHQEVLRETVSRIDAYVLANASPAPSQEQIDAFKRQQGGVGSSQEELCGNAEVLRMYEGGTLQDPARIRQQVDELLARPGQPTWGTCL